MSNLLAFLILISAASGINAGQFNDSTILTQDYSVDDIISRLKSVSIEERIIGLSAIDLSKPIPPVITDQLISLLASDVSYLAGYPLGDMEYWYDSYFLRLVRIVSQTEDERAIPLIVDSFNYASSPEARSYLAFYGESAAIVLLEKMDDPRRTVSKILSLKAILNRERTHGDSLPKGLKAAIRRKMIEQIETGRRPRRDVAVRVLGEFDDLDTIQYLQLLSETDPEYIEVKVEGKIVRVYPIREEAKKQLNKLGGNR